MAESKTAKAGPKIRLLALGISDFAKAELEKALVSADVVSMPFDVEKLLEPLDPMPLLIVSYPPPAELPAVEAAQLLRGVYTKTPIYFVGDIQLNLDRKNLMKNGFTDVFFMPIDKPNFLQVLKEQIALLGGADRVYRNVKVLDIEADRVLDFNTYLYMPANNKRIRFSAAGDPLDQERVDKLKAHSVSSLSVPIEEMKSFYAYTATTLKNIQSNSKLSETERSERLESAVRELITGMFADTATSTEHGKEAVADMRSIVKNYITDNAQPGAPNLYNRFLAISAQSGSSYSRSSAMSAYAALFAIALGVGGVEDIAIAGLLADLGLSTVPPEVLALPQSQWLPVDRQVYEGHPEASIKMIRERKLVVSEQVHKLILQHHENYCGTGFPKKLAADRILLGAQLLHIADRLFEITVPRPGERQTTPKEALEQILKECLADPGKTEFNPDVLKKLVSLFKDAK